MADNSYLMAMRNPVLQANNSYTPDTRRFTLEEEYNRLITPQNQQPSQSNPYSDYIQTLNSCTDITKEKILRDERFISIYSQCEGLLKEYLYAQIIPTVLQTQNGRIAFEQLFNVTKSLKEDYMQKDIQKERQLELLMQDEVVLRRLQELQNAPAQQPIYSPIPQQQTQQQAPQTPENASAQNTQQNVQNTQYNNQKQNYNKQNQNNPPQPKPQSGGNAE